MPNTNTLIQFKRSLSSFNDENFKQEPDEWGQPIIFKSKPELEYDDILSIGNDISTRDNSTKNTIENATFFEGYKDTSLIGHGVFFNDNRVCVDKEGKPVKAQQVFPKYITPNKSDNTKYWILSCDSDEGNVTCHVENDDKTNGIYVTGNGVMHGAAWNDYAENRKCISGNPGEVVCEQGNGTLGLSEKRLQCLPYVISDTFGMVIGDESSDFKPVAVSGRVLVKINYKNIEVGDVLCADVDGFATKMTRQEIINYPDRILGIVSEIPTYDVWNNIEIKDRVWITIK